MDDADWLAARFEESRSHLRLVAYRMLGSMHEADDAVQNSWLRLSSANASELENLTGWLTTITGRVAGMEPPIKKNTVRNSPQAIRIMLPSMAAAQARCMGAATGASQSMTASTVVLSLRGEGGAGGRNSSDG